MSTLAGRVESMSRSHLVALFISLTSSHVFTVGRRVNTPSGNLQGLTPGTLNPARALSTLLGASIPSVAFRPSCPGAVCKPTHARSHSKVLDAAHGHRQRLPTVRMDDKLSWSQQESLEEDQEQRDALKQLAAVATSLAFLTLAAPAYAEEEVARSFLNEFIVRGHQGAIVLSFVSLITQNTAIRPKMEERDFDAAKTASLVFRVGYAVSFVTGLLLVFVYGKGWNFYSHEPTFWLKMEFFSLLGAFSLFPSTRIAQRAAEKENTDGVMPRMSKELIDKMKGTYNKMFIPLVFSPIMAALSARAVGYFDWFPWPVGAAPVAATVGVLGLKSIKDAQDWNDKVYKQKEDEEFAAELEAKVEASLRDDEAKEKEVKRTEKRKRKQKRLAQ